MFMSAFAKFAYARTLRITRRDRRVGWTLAALGGLHVSCVVFFLLVGSQGSALDVLSGTVWTLPYLLTGLAATLLVYRRALFRPTAPLLSSVMVPANFPPRLIRQ